MAHNCTAWDEVAKRVAMKDSLAIKKSFPLMGELVEGIKEVLYGRSSHQNSPDTADLTNFIWKLCVIYSPPKLIDVTCR